jgi:hypothetical protein
MQLKVKNKYDEIDMYTCGGSQCDNCGLRFICYTERDEVELTWKQFYSVVKGKSKPELTYRS